MINNNLLLATSSHKSLKISNRLKFSANFMEKNMQKYIVLVRLNPSKTMPFNNTVSSWPQNPTKGVMLWGAYNIFGNWDFAIWFEADNNEDAYHFVWEKIRPIDGVMETVTMPANPIKEYM